MATSVAVVYDRRLQTSRRPFSPQTDNAQADEPGEDEVNRYEIIQKFWEDQDQNPKNKREQRGDVNDH